MYIWLYRLKAFLSQACVAGKCIASLSHIFGSLRVLVSICSGAMQIFNSVRPNKIDSRDFWVETKLGLLTVR
ncbi:hypothetical protein B0J14DRAFT_600479 [Halenospora varia]|nr:hypothetical protein B0J14DRAFT_600479 [Halenospora varia]